MFSQKTLVPFILWKRFIFIFIFLMSSSHGFEIIDGTEVAAHSLPFMALLEKNKPFCGGILIDPKWVLTAAHCVKPKNVLLGVHSIKNKEGEKDSRQVLKGEKTFPHPSFDKIKKVNDLMLLKLNKAAKTTRTVKPLSLASAVKDPAAGSKCLVAGWGTTRSGGKHMSDVLMSVNVTVVDRVKCNSPEYYNHKPVITSGMVCAGSDGTNSADTCTGDSGGPLLCNGVLVGVTSFGDGCGLENKPGVYAFLSPNQLNWIKKTMAEN